jgi:hypothetical protein
MSDRRCPIKHDDHRVGDAARAQLILENGVMFAP